MRRLLVAAVLLAGASPAAAQRVRVEAVLDTVRLEPDVRVMNLFTDPDWLRALDQSFPVILNFTLEVWSEGTGFLGLTSSKVLTRQWAFRIEPPSVMGVYTLTTIVAGKPLPETVFRSIEELQLEFERFVPVRGVAPTRTGRYHYELSVAITALTSGERSSLRNSLLSAITMQLTLPSETITAPRTATFTVPKR